MIERTKGIFQLRCEGRLMEMPRTIYSRRLFENEKAAVRYIPTFEKEVYSMALFGAEVILATTVIERELQIEIGHE